MLSAVSIFPVALTISHACSSKAGGTNSVSPLATRRLSVSSVNPLISNLVASTAVAERAVLPALSLVVVVPTRVCESSQRAKLSPPLNTEVLKALLKGEAACFSFVLFATKANCAGLLLIIE